MFQLQIENKERNLAVCLAMCVWCVYWGVVDERKNTCKGTRAWIHCQCVGDLTR